METTLPVSTVENKSKQPFLTLLIANVLGVLAFVGLEVLLMQFYLKFLFDPIWSHGETKGWNILTLMYLIFYFLGGVVLGFVQVLVSRPPISRGQKLVVCLVTGVLLPIMLGLFLAAWSILTIPLHLAPWLREINRELVYRTTEWIAFFLSIGLAAGLFALAQAWLMNIRWKRWVPAVVIVFVISTLLIRLIEFPPPPV